jgi:uncharacterized protein
MLAFDFTARTYDANGWLRISRSHITKACVNPYYGREIPNWQSLGLVPEKIYYMLRDPEELAKGAATFKGIPILSKHIILSDFDTYDEAQKKKWIVGAVGSDVEFLDPYLDADTNIWDASAIAGIETDVQREFSCCYRYVPIMTTGTYNGQTYDGIMTQIQGNHLALVESGRAGSDVLAADKKLETNPMKRTKLGNALIVALETAFPTVKVAQDSELEKVLAGARSKTFTSTQRATAGKLILAMDSKIDDKQVIAVMDALSNVDDPEPSKNANEDPESAKDAEEHPKGCMCSDCKSARDAEPDGDEPKVQDKKAKDKKAKDANYASKDEMKGAMDALASDLKKQFKEADEAKRAVREVVGDVLTMDSASEIYAFALDEMKVDRTGVEGIPALRALFNLAKERKAASAPVITAMDSATVSSTFKRFPGMARIRRA